MLFVTADDNDDDPLGGGPGGGPEGGGPDQDGGPGGGLVNPGYPLVDGFAGRFEFIAPELPEPEA